MRIFTGFLIMFAILLALREVYCWYGKINNRLKVMEEHLEHAKETNRLLRKLLDERKKKKKFSKAVKLDLSRETPDK